MLDKHRQPRWKSRLEQMECRIEAIRFPGVNGKEIAQDEEWCEVVVADRPRRIRFHDYHELFKVRGLYEGLFYQRLRCCSPSRVVRLLEEVLEEFDAEPWTLKVLDVGAGNGMVGDELRTRGVETVVGIDILQEAREATHRDRPGVYDDYLVRDLTDLPEADEKRLRRRNFNCVVSVAALGFGDVPPAVFVKALDLIDTPGWMAFNIKEDFLSEQDRTGFCRLVRQLGREEVIQLQAYRRYRHRLSITGKPLYYVAMVARKLQDVPDYFLSQEPTEAPGADRGPVPGGASAG